MRWLYSVVRPTGRPDLGPGSEHRVASPADWLQGVACLHPDRPPNDVPRHRWRQFVDDCKNFLSSPENWAERAARLAWISTERHSPNSQTAPSQSAESLTCRTRYVDWCADRAFCEFSHDPSAAMSETYPAAPLQENLLWHRPFCDSCRNWCSCVLNTGLAHTARKDVYQRTILPNLPRKILSPMNPIAVYSLGESGAVEIQARLGCDGFIRLCAQPAALPVPVGACCRQMRRSRAPTNARRFWRRSRIHGANTVAGARGTSCWRAYVKCPCLSWLCDNRGSHTARVIVRR